MTTPSANARHVAIRADATREVGVGHLGRSLALAEELLAQGHRVSLIGDLGELDWAVGQATELGLDPLTPADRAAGPDGLVRQVADLGAELVHLDGYRFPPGTGGALRDSGVAVSAMVDGDFGQPQDADLYLDQNLGAEHDPVRLPVGATVLRGADYALLRDRVLARRGVVGVPHSGEPRLLVVFGGTDPFGGTEVVVDLLTELGRPLQVEAVASSAGTAERLRAMAQGSALDLRVHPTLDDLPGLAVQCDGCVSAAGSSVWELLCLGVPTGVVRVIDNQEPGYRRAVVAGVVVGLGELASLRSDPQARRQALLGLQGLCFDLAERTRLQRAGRAVIDGAGRSRVVAALLALLENR